jgi:hypothetical protein
MVVVALGFGPQIDRRDRRRSLMGAQLGSMFVSAMLLAGSRQSDPPLTLLYVAAALNAGLVSIVMPTRPAMTPNLMAKDLLAPRSRSRSPSLASATAGP